MATGHEGRADRAQWTLADADIHRLARQLCILRRARVKVDFHLRVLCDVRGDTSWKRRVVCVGLHFPSWIEILNGVTACVRAKLISTSI